MFAPGQNTPLSLDCKVTRQDNAYTLVGTFQCHVGTTFDAHELDQNEAEIETIGQEFKRQLTQYVTSLKPPTVVLTKLPKQSTRNFTSMARGLSPSSHGTAM